MRSFIPAIALVALAACDPTTAALVSGNPGLAVDLAKGAGSVSVDQNGSTSFRYVFAQSHLDGVVPPADQESARMDIIGNFIGERQVCIDGWNIASRSIVSDSIVYEGRCKG